LGARGAVGACLADALGSEAALRLSCWSGEPGPSSYGAFEERWRAAPEESAVVVVSGGRSSGSQRELVDSHLGRVAGFVDLFEQSAWPAGMILVGSAAELLDLSPYGTIKGAQHRLLTALCARARVPLACLRLHSLVPRSRPTRGLFGELLLQFEAGGDVEVHHLGGARDYLVDVQLGIACAAVAARPRPWSEGKVLVDIGNGAPVRVGDWLDAFAEVFARRPAIHERAPGYPDPEIVAEVAPLRALLSTCDPGAVQRYDAARPQLQAIIRGWRAEGP
jgi:hypothetical protein